MAWRLEVVVVPVADIDRGVAFYADRLGFTLDHDVRPGPGNRIVQLTPPGSGCSIVLGEGVVPAMTPGSLRGLQLVVPDVVAAREQLVGRGVEVSEIQVLGGDPDAVSRGGSALDDVGFVFFDDPDGNAWTVQQMSQRNGS
ncbi:VOC family protein [Pseudonocardia sp. HH130630-07]|uniref:VOC family protein n=1 Tax=Pseudonocardia sp. HH130630-07 TaxID=1690815 RepID=UPI0008152032|nr:VOC family protein [Pseudonocardia sp. HH130630-07]ANY06654.1 glyoxalase [Pseudonocardia sp. HH130630-07]